MRAEPESRWGRRLRSRAPEGEVFSQYLARDASREQRRRSRRRTLVLSVVIHAVVIGGALVYSFWDVDELFSPSVKVTIMKGPPAPVPAPPPPPSPAR